jgi:hypothetical protein
MKAGPKELARRTLRERAASALSRVMGRRKDTAVADGPGEVVVLGSTGDLPAVAVADHPVRSPEYTEKAVAFYEAHRARSRESMRRSRARKRGDVNNS